jgi:prepilin-type N-terminal cleavage/methylation domain-containing protein
MKMTVSREAGFTLVEIMIVCAIVGLLAAIAIPNFIASRNSSNRSVCIANLKQINDAKTTWAMEAKKSTTDKPLESDLFGYEKYISQQPYCPANGVYTLNTVDARPTCTLSVAEGHSL